MIKLIFFDMDGVLTVEKSSWFYVNNRLGINNRENFINYMKGNMEYEEFFKKDLVGWTQKLPELKRDFIISILDEIPEMPGIQNTISYLKRNKIITIIVSGGISWLSDRLTNKYSIDQAYANIIYTDENGTIIPEGKVMVNPLKKDKVMRKVMEKYNVSPDECIAVGDSDSDYSMYRAVPNFVAFNSDSNLLLQIAKTNLSGNLESIKDFIESN
ncbi:HAD-IB family phosphatase [Ferroplasma sp.]|uniref:HAD-IB family phosphatase n=1 Tax=Ferroplasma sp. TaxID=2591003 RepID=UPI00307CE805